MSVVVVGLNHRTVPLDVLERMTVSHGRLPKALADLSSRDSIAEAVVLSTCNRTEVYADVERFHSAFADIRNFLAELGGFAPEDFSGHLYSYYEDGAISHLFKVASGIDSAVVGEGEILGQVRQAWERARHEGACGPMLGRLFRHAVEVGKRARRETSITRGTTSVPQAAVAMATARLGSLAGRKILVLGAGEMGEATTVALASVDGVGEVVVANRTVTKAIALAKRAGGRAVDLSALPALLAEVDVILTSTTSPNVVIEAEDLAEVMTGRVERPLLVVDIAVPRDVDPGVRGLPGVTLLDMDDLRAFAASALADRAEEAESVRAIVEEEVERFVGSTLTVAMAPVVAALRARAEEVRQAELARHRPKLDALDERERALVEAVTRGVVAKLLHEPTVRLKGAAGTPRGDRLSEAVRALFDL